MTKPTTPNEAQRAQPTPMQRQMLQADRALQEQRELYATALQEAFGQNVRDALLLRQMGEQINSLREQLKTEQATREKFTLQIEQKQLECSALQECVQAFHAAAVACVAEAREAGISTLVKELKRLVEHYGNAPDHPVEPRVGTTRAG